MGISFEIDTEEGVIYSIAEGKIGLADLQAHREKLVADPRYHPDLGHIIEFRLGHLIISEEEAKTLASDHATGVNPRKLAIVGKGLNKKASLQYQQGVKGKTLVEVFTDFGSAKEWVTSD